MNKSGGSEIVKTGSQVLDSICISEAEKQAVLTLIREEVHTFIAARWIPSVCLLLMERILSTSLSARFQLKADVFHFQIITKEVEVGDWKKKFDASRQEVTEMRLAGWFLVGF